MKLLDTQKYSECQLVAVINAATFLGEPPVDPDSHEYERLVDLAKARYGGALSIRLAVGYLRLIYNKIQPVEMSQIQSQVIAGCPVSVSMQHPLLGLHSVLLTDGNPRSVRVWNLRRKGFLKDRLSWDRLQEMMSAVAPQVRRAGWYELDHLRIDDKGKA